MDEYDVCVIGAGFGGASVAALLAHSGRRVALLEKTARAGGKAQTTERLGYRFEMFGAVGIPALNSRFHELVERLGITDRVQFVVPQGEMAAVRYKAPDGSWRSMRAPLIATGTPAEIANTKRVYGLDDADLAALGNYYAALFALDDAALVGLESVGTYGWLQQFGLHPALEAQICMNLNTLFVAPVNRLAASEAVPVLRAQALGGAGRYHVGGYGRVAEVCAEVVTEQGGLFRPKCRATQIVVEGGRAVGVATADGVIRARSVISGAGIQPTILALAGREHFPPDYVRRVEALEPSWSIAGYRYVLDARVFDAALIPVFSDQSWLDDERFARMERGEWPDVPLIAIDVASEFDPSLVAVPGHQVANCQVFCSADPESTLWREAIRRADAVIGELWPDLARHVLRKEPYGPKQVSGMSRDSVVPGAGGEAVGLAQVVGQVGRSKPDARTPLAGLYLVGCDAGGTGAGTHQAVDSGFKVAAMVDADLG